MSDDNEFELANLERRLMQLARASLSHWSLAGDLRLIKHRENAVYALQADNGKRYALRVHRAGYHSDQSLRSELQWIEALANAGIGVPSVVPTRAGEAFVRQSIAGLPEARQVDLLDWIGGEQIGSIEAGLGDDPQQIRHGYRIIGRTAAAMHNQASRWQLPAGFCRHAWDSDGLVGSDPLWGRFWELRALDNEQRELITRARAAVRVGLESFGQSNDNYSMIHADFVPENFLVDGDCVRVIDFDDAGFGWHLFDLATALYFIQDDPGYAIAREALIDSYRELRALSDETLSRLSLFTAARSFTYLGWVHTRENTQTAKELTPLLVDMCCRACTDFLHPSR